MGTSIGICFILLATMINGIFGQDHHDPATTQLAAVGTTQHDQQITTQQTTQHPLMDTDSCIETGKQNLQKNLNNSFPQFSTLTNNLTSPRNFYQNLFNQSFTKDSYQTYCAMYKTGRAELDKCANTTAKTIALIQLALADYACTKKATEYADGIVCLQNINNDAEASQCKVKCAKDEQASINHKNPPPTATKTQLTEYAMGDCLYTKCMAECRKSTLEKKCEANKSDLEFEALKTASQAMQLLSNSSAVSTLMQNVFPDQCRDLAQLSLKLFAGAGNDYLAAATNGSLTFPPMPPMPILGGAGAVGATTQKPGGGAEKMIKSSFSMIMALVLAKILF